jgi:hypothetical protein
MSAPPNQDGCLLGHLTQNQPVDEDADFDAGVDHNDPGLSPGVRALNWCRFTLQRIPNGEVVWIDFVAHHLVHSGGSK